MDFQNVLLSEIDKMKARYTVERPNSRKLQELASLYIPGGTTRTVLAFDPFPFRVSRATSTELIDVDGYTYLDFCGDHTNGLFGHTCQELINTVTSRLQEGWSIGATHETEIKAASLMCNRFRLEKVRFTNSGTEANMLSILLCMYLTKKEHVLVFLNGFHGSFLSFNTRDGILKNELNAPFSFIVEDYNKVDDLDRTFKKNNIGCVLVEPMQGSGGCIPAQYEFLRTLRELCNKYGAYLIFDEVMTSRLHPQGLKGYYNISPDLSTYGKYLGGGFSFGAFGGKSDLMNHFNGVGDRLRHSIASMTACVNVLSSLFSEKDAENVNTQGDELRHSLNNLFLRYEIPIYVTGLGSMMHLHSNEPLWIQWMFYSLVLNGIYIAPNGLISLSLVIQPSDIETLLQKCEMICRTFQIGNMPYAIKN